MSEYAMRIPSFTFFSAFVTAALPCALFATSCSSKSNPTDAGHPEKTGGGETGPLGDGLHLETGTVDQLPGDTKPGPPAKWETTGSLLQPREQHTGTTLKDGTVLVAGGIDPSYNGLKSSEIYDSTTGKWTNGGDMVNPHLAAKAVRLSSGKVLVIGGCISDLTSSCPSAGEGYVESYDPSQGAGKRWAAAQSLLTARRSHSVALLNDGTVFVAGGWNGSADTTSIEIFDPSTGNWGSPSAVLSAVRNIATATTLQNGKVIIAGGYDAKNSAFLTTLDVFDSSKYSISTISGKLTEARGSHTATLLSDGRVLMVGGVCDTTASPYCAVSTAETFDPSMSTVQSAGSPGSKIYNHTATLLGTGKVLITGGSLTASKAFLYDPKKGFWTQTASLKEGRYYHTASLLSDGRVLVAGGYGSSGVLQSAEIYTP
jgi:hypothetical protein